MTSGTGNATADRPTRRDGFTLVELIVVIGILMILMGLVFVVAGNMRKKAAVTATEALMERLETMLTRYRSEIGSYPSDGIDKPLSTEEGTELRSGAALTFALVNELKIRQKLPGGELRIVKKAPLGEFVGRELARVDEDDPQAVEVLDAWGEPVHYDNVSGKDSYSPQGLDCDVHLSVTIDDIDHGEDPRETEIVRNSGPQNTNQFDIWSTGVNGHTPDEKPEDVIANFPIILPDGKE